MLRAISTPRRKSNVTMDSTLALLNRSIVAVAQPEGNTLKVTATLFGKLLEKRVPSDVFAVGCNASVFDARCGLDENSHQTTGTIHPANLGQDRFTLTVPNATGWGGPAYPANFFGPNGVLRTGSGRTRQIATILTSALNGGDLVLTLNRPLWSDLIDANGQAVQLLPGCGGQYKTDCTEKFNNAAHFRGFPFMPTYIDQTNTGGVPKPKK